MQHTERHIQAQWLYQEIRRIMLEQEYKSNQWQETAHNCQTALGELEVGRCRSSCISKQILRIHISPFLLLTGIMFNKLTLE